MDTERSSFPTFLKLKPDIENDEESNIPTKSKPSTRSGGFQSMGLSFNVLKGVIKRGYKIPTPIQRKAIPLIIEGRDVVAMARTGSGKTACFLIPMFHKLKQRGAKVGARALILSPTRELALQTLKFIKEIGRFTDLKSAIILGGDSMDNQFSVLHGNPDIIVATPGRFLHICIEMDLKLTNIEFVVFDEADRLFEMGLGQQLGEIASRLPSSRQTVLFSATLPKVLIEFAKAGLTDPVLIRLDVESKLPNELELGFISVRQGDKLAALLVLLKLFHNKNQKTVVFAATKHHVEYLHLVLDYMGIDNTYIYSNLDPSARKIHAAKFTSGKAKVLVVTDVAARGIDIPHLDYVINYHFPSKSKLFVHRVGRCARAGRSGKAYSLVSSDEYAHLIDLHLFLGRPISMCSPTNKNGNFGKIPQNLVEEEHSTIIGLHEIHNDLNNLKGVAENGYQQYMRTRPVASTDSNRTAKDLQIQNCSFHPLFKEFDEFLEEEKECVLDKMKTYRPPGTIFEICGKNKSLEYMAMKEKRAFHKEKIGKYHTVAETHSSQLSDSKPVRGLADSNQNDITETFREIIQPKKRKLENLYKKRDFKYTKDDNYIPYNAIDKHTEEGLAVNNFQAEATTAELDIIGDSEQAMHLAKQLKRWDRKKKKMVGVQSKTAGKIKTESGVWIPSTYKSDRYDQWKQKTKVAENEDDFEEEGDDQKSMQHGLLQNRPNTHWARHNEKSKQKLAKSEVKSTDEIMKARKIAAKNKRKNLKKGKRKGNRRRKM